MRKAIYKFVRFKNCRGAYAVVGVICRQNRAYAVTWAPDLAIDEKNYALPVAEGIWLAMETHKSQGGLSAEFEVVKFEEYMMDTLPDAVFCAAGAAAWRALGHDEKKVAFKWEENWRITSFYEGESE